jgi:hypothetical protein
MGSGRLLAIAVAIIVSISQQSQGQTRNHLLKGLHEVEIIVEELSESNKACGINEDAVFDAIKYPVSSSNLRIQPLAPVVIYVQITSIFDRADNGCFSNIEVRAYDPQSVTLDFSGADKFVSVLLWRKNVALWGSRDRHPHFVTETVEQYVKKFIIDWKLDNKDALGDEDDLEAGLASKPSQGR